MSGDGVSINKQAASNALSDWDHGADSADSQFKAQAGATSSALDNGSWIGDDDAGKAFRAQFDVPTIHGFLTGGKQYGGIVTAGIRKLGRDARTNVERSLASDEQQRQEMDKAKRTSSATDGSSGKSSSGPSSAAPTSASGSPTAAANQASGTDAAAKAHNAVSPAKTHPGLFKGPLQWGIEGSDGKWHPLPAHADLKAKEYQGPLQWGIEGSDGKWYPLPANEHPTSINDRGALMHLMPASNEPTATNDRGPLMHIVPMVPSEVVGHHGHSAVDPQTGQQWQGEAAQTSAIVNGYQPTNPSTGHAAVTSAETAPGFPTSNGGHPAPEVNASNDTVQQGVQQAAVTSAQAAPAMPTPVGTHEQGVGHAAVTSAEAGPALPTPVEHKEGVEPPRES